MLIVNFALLIGVLGFVINSPTVVRSSSNSLISSEQTTVSGPLDQVSSADIAVNVARLTHLAEATNVANQADTVNSELAAPRVVDSSIIPKPQVMSAALPSHRDIQVYTTVAGDTIDSVASTHGISSSSVRWSNNLTRNNLATGLTLYLPPAGVNGIVYTVKSGDTPASLANKFNAAENLITAYNDAEINGLKVGERIIIPNGSIASPSTPNYGFGPFAAAYGGYNGYDFGWCTWYAAKRRAEMGRPVASNYGNARSWKPLAERAGVPTGNEPRVGAVAWTVGGNHVSVVEAVNPDGSFWISEMNSRGQRSMTDPTPAGGWNRIDYKLYPASAAGTKLKFIY